MKSLILYQSASGNTGKVAIKFKEVFEKKGWQCDTFKVEKSTDIEHPPFNFDDYDFLCAGSGVNRMLPYNEISNLMYIVSHPGPIEGEPPSRYIQLHSAIFPGPKSGIVFATYGGLHLGPKEAEPALSILEVEIEHLKFKCIGKFSCPGKHDERSGEGTWHGDIRQRPNERDLFKAEIFMEDKIEDFERSVSK